jgi:hypothetical protein
MQRTLSWIPVVAIAAIAGCASTPPSTTPASPAPTTTATPGTATPAPAQPKPDLRKTAAEVQLDEGTALYDTGDFNGAIRRLTTGNDLWSGPVPLQVQGLKYLAFSYCVTNRVALCQQQFEKALKLDPSFDLPSAEKTHPIWGPAFQRAKNPKPATAPATTPAAPTTPASATAPKPAAPPAKPAGQ